MRLLPFLLLSLVACLGCRTRWQPVGVESLRPEGEDARLAREPIDGRRDFAASLEAVWDATVAALHASGIAVPLSARSPGEGGGEIALEAVDVHLWEEARGGVAVLVRFRGIPEDEGVARAEELLTEIERRLAGRHGG